MRNTIITLVLCLLLSASNQLSMAAEPQGTKGHGETATKAEPSSGDKESVVITIGTRKITAAEFEKMIDLLPPQYKIYFKGPGKRQFANEVVKMELLVGEAIRRKLDSRPEVKDQLELARANILASAALGALEKEVKVSDEEVERFYNEHKKEFEEIRARHILIKGSSSILPPPPGAKVLTDEEAKAKAEDLWKQVLQGSDFAQLAQKNSDDAATAAKGGDLGFFKRGKHIPPFEDAAFALEPGQVSEVVQTPFGFEIIKIESKKSLAEAKEGVAARVQQVKANERVSDLIKQANPVINESYFHSDHPGEPMPSWDIPARPKNNPQTQPPEKKP